MHFNPVAPICPFDIYPLRQNFWTKIRLTPRSYDPTSRHRRFYVCNGQDYLQSGLPWELTATDAAWQIIRFIRQRHVTARLLPPLIYVRWQGTTGNHSGSEDANVGKISGLGSTVNDR